ncbi:MAG: PLP-dependent aspartate aminotransferase family protein [Alphaproteobacteria bacterium]|nr:PLP-dependent aspartate aminotransferase family protein [Alphaproteobacteria bacterium]
MPGPARVMATPPHVDPTPLEARMADLEGGAQGFAFSSGRAAIACLLELVNSGAHVIVSDGLHGGCYRLLEDIRRRASGMRISYVDPTDWAALDAAFIEEETKMVWVESPGSPKARLADLGMIATFAKDHDLISICDNTHCTPYLQRPLEHGFGVSLNAAPGYLYGGVVKDGAIAVVAPEQDFLVDKLGFLRAALGVVPASTDMDLALRALGSLGPRMERVCDTAEQVAAFLAAHPRIKALDYPGFGDHTDVELTKRQMVRAGGFMSVVLDADMEATRRFLERLNVIAIGEGPAGPGSVINHPSSQLFSSVVEEIRAGLGLTNGLCRLWVGLEDGDDLVRDLSEALG